MNKIYKILCAVFAVVMATACDEYDDRYSPEYASVVRLSVYGENTIKVLKATPETVFEFKVLRSGHDISGVAKATVRSMTEAEWTSYANTYGVQRYYTVPSECFSFEGSYEADGMDVSFESGQIAGEVSVTIDSKKLQEFSASLPPPPYQGAEWANVICLPLTLEVDNGSVYSECENLILRLSI